MTTQQKFIAIFSAIIGLGLFGLLAVKCTDVLAFIRASLTLSPGVSAPPVTRPSDEADGEALSTDEQPEPIASDEGESGGTGDETPPPPIDLPLPDGVNVHETVVFGEAGQTFRYSPVPDATYAIIHDPGQSNYRLKPEGGIMQFRASGGEILIPVIATGMHHIVLYVGG